MELTNLCASSTTAVRLSKKVCEIPGKFVQALVLVKVKALRSSRTPSTRAPHNSTAEMEACDHSLLRGRRVWDRLIDGFGAEAASHYLFTTRGVLMLRNCMVALWAALSVRKVRPKLWLKTRRPLMARVSGRSTLST